MSWVAIGVGVVGAGVGLYGASQAGKGSGQSRGMGELGGLPYGQQLKLAGEYADAQFDLNKRQAYMALDMAPQFGQMQRSQAEQMAKSLLKMYPQFAAAESAATSKVRDKDLKDFQRNSGAWYQALYDTSPAYAAMSEEVERGRSSPLLDYLNAQAFMAGPSALRQELESQALTELQLGGALSAEDDRLATQSARQAWSDRGLLYSNPAAVSEVLNRDYLSRERRRDRQEWGATVQGLALNEDTVNRNFGIGVQGANEAQAGNWRNYLVAASQAQLNPILQAGMQRTPVNPMSLLGLYQQGSTPVSQFSQVVSTAPSIYQGVQALTPLYNYANDVYGTNFAAAESRANAQANAYSAIGSGLMSSAGGIYSSGMRRSSVPSGGGSGGGI